MNSSNPTFNNVNVSNSVNTTNLNATDISTDTLTISDTLSIQNLNLTGSINSNTTLQNLNSLDTTSSITSQFIDAKNYTDSKYNLLLSNPDININSISELYNILGNDPTLNVANSLGDKISKSQPNQTIDALNMNWTNPIISSDFTIKNTDNSTQSVKTTLSNNSTSITNLNTNKLDRTGGTGTDNQLISPLVRQHLYISNSGEIPISLTKYSTSQGVIAGNLSSGEREINFVNTDSSFYNNTNLKAFCFHKFMNDNSTLDDFFTIYNNGRAVLKGDLISNNISIATLNSNLNTNTTDIASNTSNISTINSNLSNNYFTKTQVNSAFYTKIEVDMIADGIIQNPNNTITISKPVNISNSNTDTLFSVKGRIGVNIQNPVLGSSFHVVGHSTLDGQMHITGDVDADTNINSVSITTGSIQTNNVNKKLYLNSGLSSDALVSVQGRLGINIENPVAGSSFYVIGNSTMDGQLHITQNVNANQNINASSFTINNSVNIGDTLNNNATLINTNTNKITALENYKKKLLENSYANKVNIAYGSKYTSNKEIQLIFTSKNASPFMPALLFPITFRLSCFFYREDTMVQGQCSCDLMILPVSFLASWGDYQNTIYCINNSINGNTGFGYSTGSTGFAPNGRQYWTYNQAFEMTTGGAGFLWAYNTQNYTTQIWTHTIKIAVLFNSQCTYTFNVKSLDLTGASNFNVDIVF